MSEFIEIRGARENNLKEVSLRIPKRRIFAGVPKELLGARQSLTRAYLQPAAMAT